jgi:hypothetical protein
MIRVFPVEANRVTNCIAGQLSDSFVDASQRGIKVLLGILCSHINFGRMEYDVRVSLLVQ